ncbi:MAG TPA: alpha/beta hydrolase [Polyangiaceae bacterium]|nr:alpha/beta hydrolase [Polyangiaceae bacterium]
MSEALLGQRERGGDTLSRHMAPVLILPGYGGSGPEHWQTRWEALHPEYRRVEVPDWNQPDLDVWVKALGDAAAPLGEPPVIVAHSLGCLVVAHFAGRGGSVRAALLVAVPDPSGPEFPPEARGFADLPLVPLGFRSRVVASRNDPYGSFELSARCARAWGSELSDVGALGHINADSGLGDWPEGERLLSDLLG